MSYEESRWQGARGLIAGELDAVQKQVEARLDDGPVLLQSESVKAFVAGGKRLRASMVVFFHAAAGGVLSEARNVAAAVEVLHSATLVHDDIIDEATIRRGQPTLNSLLGTRLAVLAGDYLFAKAFSMIDSDMCARVLATAVEEMVFGELDQVSQRDEGEYRDYYTVIERKTASLFGACAESGVIMAGADSALRPYAIRYGRAFGRLFQIVDDYHDLVMPEDVSGKDRASDIRTGMKTLPLELVCQISGKDPSLLSLAELTDICNSDEYKTQIDSVLSREKKTALDSLGVFGNNEYVSALVGLVDEICGPVLCG